MTDIAQVRVSELEGAALDYWVARAEGHKPSFPDLEAEFPAVLLWEDYGCMLPHGEYGNEYEFSPSQDWNDAGPLFDKFALSFDPLLGGGIQATARMKDGQIILPVSMSGNDYLVAACRAIIAATFGATVPAQEPE